MSPRFSVIVPMLNEQGIVQSLASEIGRFCEPIGPFEAIFVNDGSTDNTASEIASARSHYSWLRELRHSVPLGQSAAVLHGVEAARTNYCCTIDGDGQNPPSEIPRLVAPFLSDHDPKLGLVAGQRLERQDTASKKIASRLANQLRTAMLMDSTRDTGCGLKAFRRDVFLRLPYFDHIHRYLPALVKRAGFEVLLVDVAHRAREQDQSKYTNFGRAMVGFSDLLGVWWLLRRAKSPISVEDLPFEEVGHTLPISIDSDNINTEFLNINTLINENISISIRNGAENITSSLQGILILINEEEEKTRGLNPADATDAARKDLILKFLGETKSKVLDLMAVMPKNSEPTAEEVREIRRALQSFAKSLASWPAENAKDIVDSTYRMALVGLCVGVGSLFGVAEIFGAVGGALFGGQKLVDALLKATKSTN